VFSNGASSGDGTFSVAPATSKLGDHRVLIEQEHNGAAHVSGNQCAQRLAHMGRPQSWGT